GSLSSKTIAITGTGYTKAEWFVDNNLVDSGNNTTIQASKYSPGTHTLTLEVFRGGARWSKEISFTVVGQ
ncbi:MAG: hypothetical protein LBU28_09475, partial [Spirochaetaceae bacterium]|nr:hypothetical protein [Spirochaetaceae bacterium]